MRLKNISDHYTIIYPRGYISDLNQTENNYLKKRTIMKKKYGAYLCT